MRALLSECSEMNEAKLLRSKERNELNGVNENRAKELVERLYHDLLIALLTAIMKEVNEGSGTGSEFE